MGLDLSRAPAAVFVFAQPDCPACHEFTPSLFRSVKARAAQGFVVCDGACPLQPGQIPVLVYDVNSTDTTLQGLIQSFNITMTPTTLVLLNGPGSCKVEGALTDFQIDQLLELAATAGR